MLDLLYAEINKIQDSEIREYTYKIASEAPVNSWKLPSGRDHHLKDECGEWGNLIHTVRVARICNTLADILDLQQPDRDILRSAAVLHDSCKHGVNAEAVWIYREHPQLVRGLIEKVHPVVNNDIVSCIEQHMGRWGNVPCDWSKDNTITISFLLHVADCIEARLPELGVKKNK